MKLIIPVIGGVAAATFGIHKIMLYQTFNMMVGRNSSGLGRIARRKDAKKTVSEDEIWIRNVESKEVRIKSFDGTTLIGHYLEAPNAKRTLLMLHGWRGNWARDFGPSAREFIGMECNILIIEERAHGGSGGDYIGFGVLESKDCHCWIDFLMSQNDLPIYLVGVSMGATAVIMAAGQDLPKQVKGIVADSGFTNPYDIVMKVAHGSFPIIGAVVKTLDKICKRKAGYGLSDNSTIESLKHVDVPVFFAHGKKDSFVPLKMGFANYDACTAKKTFFTVDDAEHAECFRKKPQEYKKAVVEFFGW